MLPSDYISKYFTGHDALWLPQFNCHHIPSQSEVANILRMANKADTIRRYLGAPMVVHTWIRPFLNNPQSPFHGQNYNSLVGGSRLSGHIPGLAIDFHVVGMTCDEVRAKLLPMLEEFQIRMENRPGTNWVHIDLLYPRPHRYFIP